MVEMRALLVAVCSVAACGFRAADVVGHSDGGVRLDVVFMDAPPPLDAAPADWWDPTYRWRIPLTITNGSPTAMAKGFQVAVHFDLDAAPCTGSHDGVRVVYNHVLELDRVVDDVGTAAEWTWFPIQAALAPSASTTAYTLYCANPAPPPPLGDPTAVFDFFDDFNGTSLSSAWTTKNTVTVAGGVVTVGGGGVTDSGLLTTATFGPNTGVDYLVQVQDPATADFWAGFQVGFPDMPPWIQWWSETASNIRPDYASTSADQNEFLGTNVALDTAMHLYGVEYYGMHSMYRYLDAPVEHHDHATAANPAMLNFRLHNHSSSNPVKYGMARVRKAVDPPPTVVVGTPETY
jgi:hypothetical protein